MKHFVAAFFAFALSLGLAIPEAEAKRLGGGGSTGMQRQMTPQQAPRQPSAAPQTPQQGATAGAQPKRSWMGPVAGLAAGLGLAALFSHLGMGEELASFMMIALLVLAAVVLFRMLARRKAAATAPMQYAAAAHGPAGSPAPNDWRAASAAAPAAGAAPLASASTAAPALPRDFDAEGFARQAKVNFIRMQAANDAGNLDDIREFTTPEMFAEIRMQVAERGAAEQRTDVVELNAEVIEVAEEAARYVVSVRFTGLLREEADSAPAPFDEVWHLTKPVQGGGWVVAGIQQVS